MKIKMLLIALLSGILFVSPVAFPSFGLIVAGSNPCSATILAENNANNAIQTALNEAAQGVFGPSAKVCVGSGTYPEQLNITSRGSISLLGVGPRSNPTIIEPNSVVAKLNDPDSGIPEAPIILAGGHDTPITGVTISHLVVDGSLASSSITGCSPDYLGVLYVNASGVVSANNVTNTYASSPSLYGCQLGQGIYVQNGLGGGSSTVTITGNNVSNYQKNGITCNDVGTKCTVTKNIVYPLAAAESYIASNGIQIGYGAKGTVSYNTVLDNVCNIPAPTCGPVLFSPEAQATGILTYQSKGAVIKDNNLTGNDNGIGVYGDVVSVTGNQLLNNRDEGIINWDGTYVDNTNSIMGSAVGIAVVSDGSTAFYPTLSNTTVATIKGNAFATDPILVQILTASPGIASVNINGFRQLVSGNSMENITSF